MFGKRPTIPSTKRCGAVTPSVVFSRFDVRGSAGSSAQIRRMKSRTSPSLGRVGPASSRCEDCTKLSTFAERGEVVNRERGGARPPVSARHRSGVHPQYLPVVVVQVIEARGVHEAVID